MKKKLCLKAIWNFIALVAGSYFVIESFYRIAIKPFFTKQMAGFTPIGLIVFVISLFVIAESWSYLNERIGRQKIKSSGKLFMQ